MPRYKYKARDAHGKAVEAVIDVASDNVIEQELSRQGLHLISAEPLLSTRAAAARTLTLSQKDLLLFTMELATSYKAGLALMSTLEEMALGSESRQLRRVIGGVAERVRGGASLAEALGAFPKAFPALYVELVNAAERTGRLDRVLDDLVAFLEWQKDVKGQIASATIYPASMIGAVVLLAAVLVLFVFPKFLSSFGSSGTELPLPTAILLGIDNFVRHHPVPLFLVAIGVPGAYLSVRNIPPVRWQIDTFKLRMPIFGPLLTKVLMSRFAHNLAMMLGSGLEFSTSLRIIERIMGNRVLEQLVADARAAVEQGKPLSDAMAKGNHVPTLVRRMLKLGETTGQMEESLENVSKFYDKEVPRAIKSMFAVFEPLILVVMAALVLFMASAIFLPLYSMINKMGVQ